MHTCKECGKGEPKVSFDTYPSGTLKCKCRLCFAVYRKQWRKKKNIKSRPDYMPECGQMRHPNPLVMEGNVMKAMKRVHDEYLSKPERIEQ